MNKICLLIHNQDEQDKLNRLLINRYALINTTDSFPQESFDLCITDTFMFDKFRKELQKLKDSVAPVFLPVLLVTSRKDVDQLSPKLWEIADEIITGPLVIQELMSRIQFLLKTRNQSLQLQSLRWESIDREEELDAILSSIAAGIIIFDKNRKIKRINNYARELLGYLGEDITTPYLNNLMENNFRKINGEPYSGEESPLSRALRGEVLRNETMTAFVKNGKKLWLSSTFAVINKKGAGTKEVVFVFTDISDLKIIQEQLTSERNFYNAIIETQGALVVVLNSNLEILRFNKACEEATGFSIDEVKGHKIWELIAEEDIAATKYHYGNLKCGQASEYENLISTKNGRKRYVNWRNTVLCDDNGNTQFIIATGVDVTERRNSEKRINELNHKLELRANELLASFKELESFSYSVSHDLRNPLMTLIGFSKMVIEDYWDKMDETERDYINRIHSTANKMNSIIDDMLKLSRINTKEINISNVDLTEMINSIIPEIGQIQDLNKFKFNIQNGLIVRADPQLMRAALMNLLTNACKYSGKTESPVIEVGSFNKDGEDVFFVKDNGAGFDMRKADKLFEPFFRLHSDKEFKGTGIGLAIVKKIIQRHGGKIWASSEPGMGATFYFTIEI
jgi:PAS domain S-box-containing protein